VGEEESATDETDRHGSDQIIFHISFDIFQLPVVRRIFERRSWVFEEARKASVENAIPTPKPSLKNDD